MKSNLILLFTLFNVGTNSITEAIDSTSWEPVEERLREIEDDRRKFTEANEQSLELIKFYEGFRSTTYNCSAGKSTIGYGFTGLKRSFITEEESNVILSELYYEMMDKVLVMVGDVDLTYQQTAALVSLGYNIGETALRNSTLMKKLREGDYDGARNEFFKWDKATIDGVKQPLKGLTKRRISEVALWDGSPQGNLSEAA